MRSVVLITLLVSGVGRADKDPLGPKPVEQGAVGEGLGAVAERELHDAWTLRTWWHAGGGSMFLILLLALGAAGVGIAHLAVRRQVTLVAGAAVVALALAAGVVGRAVGRRYVEQAASVVNPQDAQVLRRIGYREADVPLQFAVGAALLGAVLLGGGELLRRRGRSEP